MRSVETKAPSMRNSAFIPILQDEVLYKAAKAVNIDVSEIVHSEME